MSQYFDDAERFGTSTGDAGAVQLLTARRIATLLTGKYTITTGHQLTEEVVSLDQLTMDIATALK